MQEVNFDPVLQRIGEFGAYQKFILVFCIIPSSFIENWLIFAPVFAFYNPEHIECIPPYDSVNVTSMSACHYSYVGLNNSLIQVDCRKWNFTTLIFKETAVTRFGLVCSRHFLISLVIGASMGVSILGVTFFGWLQDRYGRKLCTYVLTTVYIIGILPSIFLPNFAGFAILRAFAFLANQSIWNCGFIYAIEFIGPSKRTLASTIMAVCDSVAVASIGLLAYLFDDLNNFTIATSAPFIVLYLFYPFVIESPRWLLSVGRINDAKKAVKVMIKWNKTQIEDDDLDSLLIMSLNPDLHDQDEQLESGKSTLQKLSAVFRSHNMRTIFFIVTFAWFAISTTYYTINYNAKNLGGNFFLTYILLALIEIPAAIVNIFTLDRFGRVWPMAGATMLCGFLSVFTVVRKFVRDWLIVILGIFAKFTVCMGFAIHGQFAAELFPTEVRGLLTSIACFAAALGTVIMPYIIELATIYKSLPMIVIGTFCICAGFSSIFLPETLNAIMPETINFVESNMQVGKAALRSNWRRGKSCYGCHQARHDRMEDDRSTIVTKGKVLYGSLSKRSRMPNSLTEDERSSILLTRHKPYGI